MKRPRFSIWMLMAVVGVVAVELAVGRALWNLQSEYNGFEEIGLNALVTQLAVFLLIRSRNRARAFWIGFVASSVVAALSCCYALLAYSDSLVASVWYEYLRLAHEYTGISVFAPEFYSQFTPPRTHDVLVQSAELALVFYLPQLAIALLGGLVALFLAWVMSVFHRRLALQPVPARGCEKEAIAPTLQWTVARARNERLAPRDHRLHGYFEGFSEYRRWLAGLIRVGSRPIRYKTQGRSDENPI